VSRPPSAVPDAAATLGSPASDLALSGGGPARGRLAVPRQRI